MKRLIPTVLAFLCFCCFIYGYNRTVDQSNIQSIQTELYSAQNGDNLKKHLIDSIQRAKSSVLLIIFTLKDPDVIAELRKKAESGVAVTVICDAKATREAKEGLGPKVDLLRRFSEGHMHPKILVIDDEHVWIGSANMTTDSLKHHDNLMTSLHSHDLAAMIWNKANSLHEYGCDEACSYFSCEVNGQPIEMSFLPGDKKGKDRVKQMLRSAQKTIRVGMFTFTRFDFAHELIQAKKRGVSVEVALDLSMSRGAGSKIAALLKKEGIPLRINDGKNLFHHKFAYIDSRCLINGSANWTKAAFTQNDDCFLILHHLDETQVAQMELLWEGIAQTTTLQ